MIGILRDNFNPFYIKHVPSNGKQIKREVYEMSVYVNQKTMLINMQMPLKGIVLSAHRKFSHRLYEDGMHMLIRADSRLAQPRGDGVTK